MPPSVESFHLLLKLGLPVRNWPHQPFASISLTIGTTFVPYNSMLFICRSCGSVPLLYFRSNRERPSAFTVDTIFFATVYGEPT